MRPAPISPSTTGPVPTPTRTPKPSTPQASRDLGRVWRISSAIADPRAGPLRVVLGGDGRTEEREHAVACQVLDVPAELLDLAHDPAIASPTTSLTSAPSSCSASAVEPTRSAKSAVIGRRSSRIAGPASADSATVQFYLPSRGDAHGLGRLRARSAATTSPGCGDMRWGWRGYGDRRPSQVPIDPRPISIELLVPTGLAPAVRCGAALDAVMQLGRHDRRRAGARTRPDLRRRARRSRSRAVHGAREQRACSGSPHSPPAWGPVSASCSRGRSSPAWPAQEDGCLFEIVDASAGSRAIVSQVSVGGQRRGGLRRRSSPSSPTRTSS